VNAIVALPDNQRALSASKDKTVKLFNVDNGAILRSFTHHNEPVWHVALLPDGRRFISVAGHDRNKAGKIMRTEAQEDLTEEEQMAMIEDLTDDGGRRRFSTIGLHGTACIVDLGGA
jgi:WD40 repeat protein